MSVDFNKIGEAIKARRKELGITQKELANKLDISQGYISDLEKGNIKNPSLNRLEIITDELKMNITRLFDSAQKERNNYLSPQEEEHIKYYRKLSEKQKAKLEGVIEGMLMENEKGATKENEKAM